MCPEPPGPSLIWFMAPGFSPRWCRYRDLAGPSDPSISILSSPGLLLMPLVAFVQWLRWPLPPGLSLALLSLPSRDLPYLAPATSFWTPQCTPFLWHHCHSNPLLLLRNFTICLQKDKPTYGLHYSTALQSQPCWFWSQVLYFYYCLLVKCLCRPIVEYTACL